MFESHEDNTTSVCPVCQKAVKAKKTSTELKLNVIPCKSAISASKENVKRLEHLLSHIDEVIDLTKQYKTEGILSPSMEKFIKTCHQAKEKIEDFANAPPSCDVCKKSLNADSRVKLVHGVSRTASSKSVELSSCRPCDMPNEGNDSTFELNPETEDKLGYFEKKFKEIIKITRLKNDDGSISEEKQVITIRTERRNPRKTVMDFGNEPIGAAGGFDGDSLGGGKSRGKACTGQKKLKDYNELNRSGELGRDGGSDYYNVEARETKSEHINCSHQMGEPKLRRCISALNAKLPANKDASTNFNNDSYSSIKTCRVRLPPDSSISVKKPCSALPKIDMTSSIDSQMCCPKRFPSVCGSELQSGKSSQISVSSCRAITTTSSVQTCCKEIPVKKPKVDKGTCCLPVCGGDTKCLEEKKLKSQSVATEALWRDAWTSSTDLTEVPSRLPAKKATSEASNILSSTNKESDEKINKNNSQKSNSCCTIKLIAKPPKVCAFEKTETKAGKEEHKEIILTGSMLDAIKKIFIGPTRSTESCTTEPKAPDIKNICNSCLSKLKMEASSKASSIVSSEPSKKSSNVSTCKRCQTKIEEPVESEVSSCASCSIVNRSSSGASISCKSVAIGSPTMNAAPQHTCGKAKASLHSEKHTCCMSKNSSSKSSSEEDNTCCAMAQTKSSKSVCCSKSKTESVCPSKKDSSTSKRSVKTQASFSDKKDATTSTKRSAKYDVRPLPRQTNARFNRNSCICKSDPCLNRSHNKRPNKCRSFYEDDYYYFRW